MNTSSHRTSITDSPWYWVYLFCTAGAVALVLASPKFAVRQAQIERNSEARQVAARLAADDATEFPAPELSAPEPLESATTRVRLWPLFVTLGIALSVAWFQLWRNHRRKLLVDDESSLGTEATT